MIRVGRLLTWGIATVSAAPALGVLVPSEAQRNLDAPPGSIAYEAWKLQGQFGAFLGTPIAPQHFVTAAHVGGGVNSKFVFRGVTYTIDSSYGTGGRIVPAGSDLAIWKVQETLPAFAPLYTDNNELGKRLVVIGRGTSRGDEVLVSGQVRGWRWGPADSAWSWGENEVTSTPDFGGSVGGTLKFDFTPGAGPNEGALSAGDSGGGVFIFDDGVWKLAGINHATDGPYSFSSSGTDPFMASLLDRRGLYTQSGSAWVGVTGPSASYASRISTRAPFIYSVAPGAPVVESSYSVVSSVEMGTVQVTGATIVGNGTEQSVLSATHVRSGSLTIKANARVVIRPNGTPAGTSIVSALDLASTAQLDLSDNDLIVQSTAAGKAAAYEQIVQWVKSGRGDENSRWRGNGIASSSAAANPLTGLAVVLNDRGGGQPIVPTFSGQNVDANSILVKYTWNGDADLNGVVDADDYFRIDMGYLRGLGGYRNGDFDYSGTVDGDDYALIDAAYRAGAPLGRVASAPVQIVPEPAIGAAGLAAIWLVLRRGRRKVTSGGDAVTIRSCE